MNDDVCVGEDFVQLTRLAQTWSVARLFAGLTNPQMQFKTCEDLVLHVDEMRRLLYEAGMTLKALWPGATDDAVQGMIDDAKARCFPEVFSASKNADSGTPAVGRRLDIF